MKLYDISQEVFECQVYPGDPAPKQEKILTIGAGNCCNLTAFSMCAHNGTHVDAPYHFYEKGKTVEQLELPVFVGKAYVASHQGELTGAQAEDLLRKVREKDAEAAKRILLKGSAVVTAQAAEVFAKAGILLLGNESQTVGPEASPMEVHFKLLGAGVVLLEGIRLDMVNDGVYILNAAPLKLGGADGAPCRAILIEE